MLRKTFLGMSLLIVALDAVATESESSFECKYDGNQQEMNACALNDFNTVDGELNKTYKQLMSRLSPSRQAALRKEQRTWLKNRDPDCKGIAKQSERGSIWPLEFFGCLKSSTERRIKELEHWHDSK
jgi:uncharacterized protein YecT (DUF1311 family)